MRVLDLFSGIGGFSLGLERAGMETVAFCEFDKKAQLVLKKHWLDILIYNDIRELTGKQIAKEIGAIDLICGGFPCQPFSVAGKQRGDQDDRHLWPEMFRLIQEIRPRWVIGENVAGLINLGLDQVLSDLESEGYTCQTFIIPACAVNAPHRRDRVWVVAHASGIGRERIGPGPNIRETKNDDKGCQIRGTHAPITSNTNRPQSPLCRQVGRMGGEESFQGLGNWEITSEPFIRRRTNGVSGRVDRLKQLGNAVVPQVVEMIGRAIMETKTQTTDD
jgi:DNA (cytosine-5)-methyltransferase 1